MSNFGCDAYGCLCGDELTALEAALRRCEGKRPEATAMMREHGFVLDNLDDRWQKLAFTLYTYLSEIEMDARHTLDTSVEGGL